MSEESADAAPAAAATSPLDFIGKETPSRRDFDLSGCPAKGSVWHERGHPERVIEVEGIHVWDDDEYVKPLDVTVSYRRHGVTKGGHKHPLCKTCVSAFTGRRVAVTRVYKERRFIPVPAGGAAK